ncbi:MAG: hypothetical protein RBS73_18235 [Prolixibacteraceae bacterium]|jgi:hypothetical protein|nr:hypothetical protein [Prolixibacteraceae bacterium]
MDHPTAKQRLIGERDGTFPNPLRMEKHTGHMEKNTDDMDESAYDMEKNTDDLDEPAYDMEIVTG